jgi:hypothetical protein
MSKAPHTYKPEERALLYYKRHDGSAYIVPVTIVRPTEKSPDRYLIRSDHGGMLIVDWTDLRPATVLDQLALELQKSDLPPMC